MCPRTRCLLVLGRAPGRCAGEAPRYIWAHSDCRWLHLNPPPLQRPKSLQKRAERPLQRSRLCRILKTPTHAGSVKCTSCGSLRNAAVSSTSNRNLEVSATCTLDKKRCSRACGKPSVPPTVSSRRTATTHTLGVGHRPQVRDGGDVRQEDRHIQGKSGSCTCLTRSATSLAATASWGANRPGAGIAFADKYRKEDHVTVCFMGDGARVRACCTRRSTWP